MSQHTPGPWRSMGASVYLERPGLDMLTVVAKCPPRQTRGGRKLAEANACLIAAAPEMYEVLKRAVADYRHEPALHPDTRAEIRALLDKIDGGPLPERERGGA